MENLTKDLCTSCYVKFEPEDAFCNACGFPLQGTQEEKNLYISNKNIKEIDVYDLNRKVESACKSLYWITALITLSAFFIFFLGKEDEDKTVVFLTSLVLAVAFLIFAVWSKKKPAAALISGLSLYVLLIILNAIVSPVSILSGIILKVVIIGYLINGIKSVIEVDKIKKEFNIY